MHQQAIMWDAILILAALASPLILLALAAGAAGPIIKIKVRLALIAFMVLSVSMAFVLRDIIFKRGADKASKGL